MLGALALPKLGGMKRQIDQLLRGLHSIADWAWYGSPCRHGTWLVMTRIPATPLLAAVLPWSKPFAWRWARAELTEALIDEWPPSAWTFGFDTNTTMLALCRVQACRLLETSLADGDLTIVRGD
jgi:hypothetical protein